MVLLHVKRMDESLFLFNTTTDAPLETVIQQITAIYNGRLKVDRICSGENLPFLGVFGRHLHTALSKLVFKISLWTHMHMSVKSFVDVFLHHTLSKYFSCKVFSSITDTNVSVLIILRDPRACRSWYHTSTLHAGADRGAGRGAEAEGWMGRQVHS